MDKKKEIRTQRLVLRSLSDSDKEDMLCLLKDPKIKATYMIPDLENKEQEDKLFNRLKEVSDSNEHFAYGVYLKDKVIGYLNDVEKNEEEIEVGYFISSKEWNKGYATEILSVAIKELFNLGYKRVNAGHFVCNPASGRVMQKCGMKIINKTEKITYRGVEHDVIYYQITNKN
ncbi:MAG: GNAT family N-acetyltransferase [Bacilli bacterium]|nr:GNAT family N-acetyltransferase [Bacilli bacterium]